MADLVDRATRSRMMAGIRGKNTKPEVRIRALLHGMGFRFRIHSVKLPGKPDIVLPRFHAVVMVHGCFWHGHDCPLFRWPATRPEFWKTKIERNRMNDSKALSALHAAAWRVATVWECAMKGSGRLGEGELTRLLDDWLRKGTSDVEISGTRGGPS